jgi:hypothetical protein
MKYFVGILLLFITSAVFAQSQEKGLVQFSGVVYNADSTSVIVPYVTITNLSNKNQVYASNYKGYFSFVVHEQDSLRFSSVGFASQTVVVPARLSSKSYTMQVLLKPQTINLPAFRVFPWATSDEFRKDFLSMKVADDDLEIARKNLSPKSIASLINTLPRNAQEIQNANALNMHNQIMNSHSLTPNPLLNPIAWGTLIKQITAGDKSRNN